ncbi:MAG: hypothetical protein ACD_64C00261G0006 [uncultured bacterium]|nr:MAG: hypothetical protein ACD_64C00261G0006 [uncultured bacterium]
MMHAYKHELLSIIHRYLPGSKVYLFGSRARGTHQSGSDIDLAVDAGKKVGIDTILNIKAAIEETTIPLFVDVVDIHAVADDFKQEILKDALLWTD